MSRDQISLPVEIKSFEDAGAGHHPDVLAIGYR